MDVSQNYLLQNIFRSYSNLIYQRRLPPHQAKAVDAITSCRSGLLGTSYYQCAEGHEVHEQHHSCRHRSCYVCSRNSQHDWIEAQKKRLLNCPHFHLVFTLPSEYRVLWRYNRAWFTRTLFASVQETVLTLMADDRHQGVRPGLLLTLHTWGRRLNLHPHIHGLVTAGGLDNQGRWHDAGDYLLPIRAIKALYRGKLQAHIKEAFSKGEIRLPPDWCTQDFLRLHRVAYKKTWSVRVEEQYRHGRGVVLYLSRYMKGGPLHPAQIYRCDAEGIGFTYKDHRLKANRTLTLKPLEFIQRLLQHVPPTGVHTVRHYGLYASASRDKRNRCRDLMGDLTGLEIAPGKQEKGAAVLACRRCGGTLKLCYRSNRRPFRKGNSLISHGATFFAQQVDEIGHANVGNAWDPCVGSG